MSAVISIDTVVEKAEELEKLDEELVKKQTVARQNGRGNGRNYRGQ